ncbi:MAG: DUF1573 domain-containing protein, partial [Nitrososphaerota archaeon]
MASVRRADPFILAILILSILIVSGGVLFAYKTSKPLELTTYSEEATDKPILELSAEHLDLGEMKVSETRTAEVILENKGTRTLEIYNISTSCDCTFVQLEIGEEKSPLFTMHSSRENWVGKIEAGNRAKLTVIYEPARMPVQGKVERFVLFNTNDPFKPEINVHV